MSRTLRALMEINRRMTFFHDYSPARLTSFDEAKSFIFYEALSMRLNVLLTMSTKVWELHGLYSSSSRNDDVTAGVL